MSQRGYILEVDRGVASRVLDEVVAARRSFIVTNASPEVGHLASIRFFGPTGELVTLAMRVVGRRMISKDRRLPAGIFVEAEDHASALKLINAWRAEIVGLQWTPKDEVDLRSTLSALSREERIAKAVLATSAPQVGASCVLSINRPNGEPLLDVRVVVRTAKASGATWDVAVQPVDAGAAMHAASKLMDRLGTVEQRASPLRGDLSGVAASSLGKQRTG